MRWGIIGTGSIAGTFASEMRWSKTGSLAAVGSRAASTADEFAAKHGIPNAHDSYEALLADPSVEAVYISTPHPQHREWAIAAAKAGKHVLVEKPAAVTAADAQGMIDAAVAADVFFMEAFMYRCHPQIDVLATLLADGVIGEVRMLHASFGFQAPFDPAGRLFDPALAGGGILDVGCYPASLAVLVARLTGAGSAEGVSAVGHVGQTGVDEWASASVRFESRMVAQLSCAVRVQLDNAVRIFGSDGRITLTGPWHGGTSVVLQRNGQAPETIPAAPETGLFALEADAVAEHAAERQAPQMPWADTMATMQILDQWRAGAGVVYPGEG